MLKGFYSKRSFILHSNLTVTLWVQSLWHIVTYTLPKDPHPHGKSSQGNGGGHLCGEGKHSALQNQMSVWGI